MNKTLRRFVGEEYPDGKGDLFASFIDRCMHFAREDSCFSLITMPSWMFLSSFEKLRLKLLGSCSLRSLLHMGRGIFGVDFGSTSFVFKKTKDEDYDASFFRLHKRSFQYIKIDDIESIFLKSLENRCYCFDFDSYKSDLSDAASGDIALNSGDLIRYEYKISDFRKIPGSPVAYWLSPAIQEVFSKGKSLGSIARIAVGLQTGSNEKFVRYWSEVSLNKCGFGCLNSIQAKESGRKWFPYNKGGGYRKWYGNNELVVNWHDDGAEVKSYCDSDGKPRSAARNSRFYFHQSITWSTVSSSYFGARLSPEGALFDVAGSSAFPSAEDYMWIMGLMCSNQMLEFMKIMNPTLSFQVGNIAAVPVPEQQIDFLRASISPNVERLVSLARLDWDAYENSWGFAGSPLLDESTANGTNLEQAYSLWLDIQNTWINEIMRLERHINSVLLSAYGLEKEFSPENNLEQVTINGNPFYRYGGDAGSTDRQERFKSDCAREFMSYGIGCMMGRYSLDHPGLILADSRGSQAEQLAAYEQKLGKPLSAVQFNPDPDGIIPVLDGEWFEDDIVARTREFLEVTFPESNVTENLRFIEDSLGKDIRKYFCTEFYKDHLQTYKKRPIYWMVQSPRKGFACLIYLHRYTKDTLNQVLNNYFRPYLQKLEARLTQLGLDQLNDSLPTRERTAAHKEADKISKVLKECQAWEQDALLPLAQQRIELDLDDGVKVNYLKLQDVLATIPGLAVKED